MSQCRMESEESDIVNMEVFEGSNSLDFKILDDGVTQMAQ